MSLFDGRSTQQKIEDAKKLLLDNGYLVRAPLEERTSVKDPRQLVRFFYDRMLFYNPGRRSYAAGDSGRELAIAKRLVESRINTGVSKDRALLECCILIDTLFKYEQEIGVSYSITNMSILDQGKMSWVSEKAWRIYEGLDREINAAKEQEWWDNFYNEQENSVTEARLETARDRMDRILQRYGKSEKEEE